MARPNHAGFEEGGTLLELRPRHFRPEEAGSKRGGETGALVDGPLGVKFRGDICPADDVHRPPGGFEVVGVTLHLWDYPDDGSVRGRCCAPAAGGPA